MFRIFELEHHTRGDLAKLYMKNIHQSDIPVIQKAIRAIVKNRITSTVELRVMRPNGAVKYILAIGELIKDANG